jgi:hypothetical protein
MSDTTELTYGKELHISESRVSGPHRVASDDYYLWDKKMCWLVLYQCFEETHFHLRRRKVAPTVPKQAGNKHSGLLLTICLAYP